MAGSADKTGRAGGMNFTQIDFSQAWIRHSMFKTRLRAFLLSGNGDITALTDPKACSLGSWLNEVAVKYAVAAGSVLEVSYLHESVHHEAGQIIALFQQHREEEARSRLGHIEALDTQILEALNTLQREIAA